MSSFSPALSGLLKVTQFKNAAQMTRIQANQPTKAERLRQQEESKLIVSNIKSSEESKGEEGKGADGGEHDDFVIVDNSYLDTVSEIHPLSNLSDFTRVNPLTAQTDFKHLSAMPQSFLIGPQFKPKANAPNARNQSAQSVPEDAIDIFAPIVYLKTSSDAGD